MNIEQEMEVFHISQLNGKMPNPIGFEFSEGGRAIMKSTDNILLSHSIIGDDTENLYLRMIYIKKESRRLGLGTSIFELLKQECIKSGISGIEVESENNSIHFFKSLGFKMMENKDNNRMILNF